MLNASVSWEVNRDQCSLFDVLGACECLPIATNTNDEIDQMGRMPVTKGSQRILLLDGHLLHFRSEQITCSLEKEVENSSNPREPDTMSLVKKPRAVSQLLQNSPVFTAPSLRRVVCDCPFLQYRT